MPGVRLLTAILAALGPVALIPGGVVANGGSFFDFERKYYVPGEVITTQTSFSKEVEKSGGIDDGPYYAYLLSSDRWIQPPRIPNDAIALGYIAVTNPGGPVPIARITFTVPEVAPGPYTLTLCNLPCLHATLGDLVGGSFSVAPTKEEALRRELSDRLDGRLAQVRGNLAARIRRAEKAQRDFTPRRETQALAERVSTLEARLARLQNEQPSPAQKAQTAPWLIAGSVLLIAGLFWLRSLFQRRPAGARTRRSGRRHQSIPMFWSTPEDMPAIDTPDRELDSARP